MHLLWGILLVVAGLFLLICGRVRSDYSAIHQENNYEEFELIQDVK